PTDDDANSLDGQVFWRSTNFGEEVEQRAGHLVAVGEDAEMAGVGDLGEAGAGNDRGRLAGARWRRVDVVLEGEHEARHGDLRPDTGTCFVERPGQARLVLPEPAGVGPH